MIFLKIKPYSLLLIIISISAQLMAQVGCAEISNFKKKKDVLIQVGFSTSEVKAKIGNPKTIEGGFPELSSCSVSHNPKMVGQMNNSTWFYIYEPITIKVDEKGYYVNGRNTTEDLYFEYKDSETVNLVDGKVISKAIASAYKNANNSNLSVIPIDKSKTFYKSELNTDSKLVIPVYCVIFDRGTQVVASTVAFFLSN